MSERNSERNPLEVAEYKGPTCPHPTCIYYSRTMHGCGDDLCPALHAQMKAEAERDNATARAEKAEAVEASCEAALDREEDLQSRVDEFVAWFNDTCSTQVTLSSINVTVIDKLRELGLIKKED